MNIVPTITYMILHGDDNDDDDFSDNIGPIVSIVIDISLMLTSLIRTLFICIGCINNNGCLIILCNIDTIFNAVDLDDEYTNNLILDIYITSSLLISLSSSSSTTTSSISSLISSLISSST